MRGSCLPNLDKPQGGALPLTQAVIQFSDGYVMAAVNGGRMIEPVHRLLGGYSPLEGLGVINQHGDLAVVEQAQRAEQLTAGRDPFPLYTEARRELALTD